MKISIEEEGETKGINLFLKTTFPPKLANYIDRFCNYIYVCKLLMIRTPERCEECGIERRW